MVGGCKRPTPYFGPNTRVPEEMGGLISPYGVPLRLPGGATVIGTSDQEPTLAEDTGIELGSKYAVCLGFDAKPTTVETPKPSVTPVDRISTTSVALASTPSQRVTSPDVDILMADGDAKIKSIPPVSSKSKRKKNKKKKQKKKAKENLATKTSAGAVISENGTVADNAKDNGDDSEGDRESNATDSLGRG